MDRHLVITLVSAVTAVLLGFAIRISLRDREIKNGPFWRIRRSNLPVIYWLGIGFLTVLLIDVLYMFIRNFLAWA